MNTRKITIRNAVKLALLNQKHGLKLIEASIMKMLGNTITSTKRKGWLIVRHINPELSSIKAR